MKTIFTHFLFPMIALFGVTSGTSVADDPRNQTETGTLESLIVASGEARLNLDLSRLNGAAEAAPALTALRFEAATDSFFPVVVFNNELRAAKPGVIQLSTKNAPALPQQLSAAIDRLVLERGAVDGQPYEIFIRDGKSGFVFFNVEGHQYDYDAGARSLQISGGRLLISEAFAKNMGRPADAGRVVGDILVSANMRPIQVSQVVNGEAESVEMPAVGTVPGPDVIVGDLNGLAQFQGASGTQVGLAVGTDACNQGVENLHWFQNPANDHPVIPQNLYRMSGGSTNTERFEQIGQSNVKHAFTALTNNICNLGCNGTGGSNLGSGCSDPYSASLNSGPNLGSRAWINPFTGFYPRNDSATPNNSHGGHAHQGPSHRILTEIADLNTSLNPGATYFAESQYVTPHEYAWCQANPGQCNMSNNVSYRQYTVSGTGSPFGFSPAGSTQRTKPAIMAWTGATINPIEPAPGTDGIGSVAYKVTNPSAGVWHYEYAIFNQTLDRAIQAFSVPLGCGVTVSNVGFHAPPQHPGWSGDGTVGNAGFSSAPWTSNPTATALSWSSETFAQNQNANAIRWATTYNFRFDSNRPPQAASATVGFFKTGSPITVAIQAPTPDACAALQMTSAVSRKVHGSVPYDINLPLSGAPGIECRRTGGTSGDHTIVVSFTNNLASGNAAVTSGTGAVSGTPAISGNTMTINLTGVPTAQQITVTLSGVTDSFAQTYPDTPLVMKALFGDVGANSAVTGSDVSQVKASGDPITQDNFRADVNVSNSISSSDISAVKSMSGALLQ